MRVFYDTAISGEMVFIWCSCGEHLQMNAFQNAITCPKCKRKYSIRIKYTVWQLEPNENEIQE